MNDNQDYLVQRESYSYVIADELRELRRKLFKKGELGHYSGDPFALQGAIWPNYAFSVCLKNGVPCLAVIQCIKCGGEPRWYDPNRPDISDPDELGLIGFWDSSLDYKAYLACFTAAFSGGSGASEGSHGNVTGDDIGSELCRVAQGFGVDLGNFVAFTGEGWISEIAADSMLDRIDAVVDHLLDGATMEGNSDV